MEIEDKKYGPDSTAEEIQLIKDQIYWYDESKNYLMYHELPTQSVFHTNIAFDEIERKTSNLESFYIIIDLSRASRPNTEVRAAIKTRMEKMDKKLAYCSAITGKNIMITMAAKFVLAVVGLKGLDICKDMDAAIKAIERSKN